MTEVSTAIHSKQTAEKSEEQEADEIIEQILWAADELPEESRMDFVMMAIRPGFRAMEPEERRRICADMEAKLSPLYGNRTGRFFNGFTSACKPREPGKELGKQIMAKRNPHCQNNKI